MVKPDETDDMLKPLLFLTICVFISLPIWGQDNTNFAILDKLNAERNANGIPSLIWNAQLATSAQRHSVDMGENKFLDHSGTDGSQFWQRMLDAGYSLSTGSENILMRRDTDAQATYDQWKNSPPHRANMMNADYIEIGIAYELSSNGTYYFTMVLGSRPDVTPPPLVTSTSLPPTSTLFPTSTLIPLTPVPTLIPTVIPSPTIIPPTRAFVPQATATATIPTATRIPPTSTPYLPPDIRLVYDNSTFAIINISGKRLDMSHLSFKSDAGSLDINVWETEFLSEPLNNFSASDCIQAWGFEIVDIPEKPVDCRFRHAWIAVGQGQLFWKDVTQFLVFKDDTAIGLCYLVEQYCDLSMEARLESFQLNNDAINSETSRDLKLLFTADSFALINISEVPVDVRGLVFQSESGRLAIERWDTEFLSQALSGFTSNDCIQAWTLNGLEQEKPSNCNIRHGWIMVNDSEDFWRDTTRFSVIRNNIVLAGCVISNGSCDVSLQGNLGVNSPTVVPNLPQTNTNSTANNANSNSDLTFVYDSTSFSLINSSGASLDISQLQFESNNGVFSAHQWDTGFLTRSLGDFSAGDCLQVWQVGGELLTKPDECRVRHAWVAVPSSQIFWVNVSEFRVRTGSQVLATCTVANGRCTLNLP